MVGIRVYKAILWLTVAVIPMLGCRHQREQQRIQGNELSLAYATHFSVEETSFGYMATVYPEGKENGGSIQYALTRNDACEVAEGVEKVHIPIARVATNSGSNFEFLRLLGVMDCLVAVCDAKYIYSESVRKRIESGKIRSFGSSYDLNVEQLLAAQPDVLLLSDLRDDPHADVCPVVHNFEWRESSALGRAEWIKFISLFFDKWHVADSLFKGIEERYNRLKSMTDTVGHRPTLFAAACFGDTWYMTKKEGYMASMYADAGADYLLKSKDVCGTEWLLANYSEVDFWMNCHTTRLKDLDVRLQGMKSYRSGRVYHFNKRMVPGEEYCVSDFYERAVAQPDVVLADLISVLHPSLLPDHATVFLGACEKSE